MGWSGTVKVLIFGKNNQAVDTETIERCQQHIDEEKPIGPTITVVTPLPIEISISAV